MAKKQISAKLKFQGVLEMLSGEKSPGQIAKQYGVHPNSVGVWREQFLERGSEIFAQENAAHEYQRRLAELEQLQGKKEVDLKVGPNPLADDSKGGPQHHRPTR